MTDPNHIEAGSDFSVAPASHAADADADANPRPLEVDVVVGDDGWTVLEGVERAIEIAAAAVAAHPGLIASPAEAVIALACDAEVARLNAAYRGKQKPTNVLSFPAPPLHPGQPAPGRRILGDIILARETVLSEAAGLAIPPVHHVQHLVVHALLHLLGYDHETDAGAVVMEALETSILAGLSIPDPYATDLVAHSKEP